MIKIGVGTSNHRSASHAGQEAAKAALEQAGVSSCDFVMMFATVGYPQKELIAAVRSVTGNAPLAGASGIGVIAQDFCDESNHAVGVLAWKSDELRFQNVRATGLKADARGAGAQVARALGEIPGDARALFVLADVTLNFDHFRQGFEDTAKLRSPLPMIGGTAADNWQMKETFQYSDDDAFTDGVSAALLSGKGSIGVEVNHGCMPIGHERTITRCEGNVIYEIDGKPAIKVLEEYLGEDEVKNFYTKTISYLCLGFKAPQAIAGSYDEYVIRFIPHKDDATGSITIQTSVEPGTKVWMTRRDAEKMHKGVEQLGEKLRARLGGAKPKAVFHFDCASRGRLMFSEDEKRSFVRRMQELVGRDIPWIGFYTSGEIAPVEGKNYFHNFTAAVSAIY
jgi:hypothetical protein